MTISTNKECEHVTTNFKQIREFITYLISDLEYHAKVLEDSFTSYLEEMKNLVTGYGNDENKIGIQKRSYRKIDQMYYRLMKVLQTVPQLISEDYDYLLSLGSGLCYVSKKIENITQRIITASHVDTVDKFQILGQLKTQLRNALFKYNKLATDYNKEVKRIDVMKSYLARGIIMYTSNISKKEYSLFIDIEVNKFVRYVEQDKVYQMKSYMIKTLLKRLAQSMRALSTNSITPIPLMSLDELPIPREQSPNTGALY
ncbi:uncharacterized protein [Chelonus insularis]|uniref:uncharacterized protein n=1 Tax=Chelonus insularis TaxID=460826 RepID=UPI00158AD077|nr:uncharacterized protein LOC118072996 [Chelonus insularis]